MTGEDEPWWEYVTEHRHRWFFRIIPVDDEVPCEITIHFFPIFEGRPCDRTVISVQNAPNVNLDAERVCLNERSEILWDLPPVDPCTVLTTFLFWIGNEISGAELFKLGHKVRHEINKKRFRWLDEPSNADNIGNVKVEEDATSYYSPVTNDGDAFKRQRTSNSENQTEQSPSPYRETQELNTPTHTGNEDASLPPSPKKLTRRSQSTFSCRNLESDSEDEEKPLLDGSKRTEDPASRSLPVRQETHDSGLSYVSDDDTAARPADPESPTRKSQSVVLGTDESGSQHVTDNENNQTAGPENPPKQSKSVHPGTHSLDLSSEPHDERISNGAIGLESSAGQSQFPYLGQPGINIIPRPDGEEIAIQRAANHDNSPGQSNSGGTRALPTSDDEDDALTASLDIRTGQCHPIPLGTHEIGGVSNTRDVSVVSQRTASPENPTEQSQFVYLGAHEIGPTSDKDDNTICSPKNPIRPPGSVPLGDHKIGSFSDASDVDVDRTPRPKNRTKHPSQPHRQRHKNGFPSDKNKPRHENLAAQSRLVSLGTHVVNPVLGANDGRIHRCVE
ncbi:hypothetical protein DL96DRAFT_485998 [Flagelloscypha sp. PMI_526]|nr:hypothetical protein DL96DRAFT_485998 [Flagelloscypha sp. PMI_526]